MIIKKNKQQIEIKYKKKRKIRKTKELSLYECVFTVRSVGKLHYSVKQKIMECLTKCNFIQQNQYNIFEIIAILKGFVKLSNNVKVNMTK